jgi:hypothetical protein
MALNYKLYFRGAVSYGDFIEYDKKFYLGEAVKDAAQWYEEGDWLGIVYTPNTAKYLLEYAQKIKQGILDLEYLYKFSDSDYITKFDGNFTLFDVPTKSGKSSKLICVNWVTSLFLVGSKPELKIESSGNTLSYYYTLMKFAKIPKGTENKYQNTHYFVEMIHKLLPTLLNIKRVSF